MKQKKSIGLLFSNIDYKCVLKRLKRRLFVEKVVHGTIDSVEIFSEVKQGHG
jgi:hypothetical protein